MKKNVSPAWAFEPVIVFTQIDRTSSITESPNIDAVSPAYRRVKPGCRKACLTTRQLLPRLRRGVASTPGRSRGAPHATNSHSREPGRAPGGVGEPVGVPLEHRRGSRC